MTTQIIYSCKHQLGIFDKNLPSGFAKKYKYFQIINKKIVNNYQFISQK